MNFLFELNHPAHFHLFKNTIDELISQSHFVYIFSKSNQPLPDLLSTKRAWEVIYTGLKGKCILSKLIKQFGFTWKAIYFIKTKKVDICVGVSITMSHAAFLTGKESFIFDDDDKSATPVFAGLSHTFASHIISPSCLDNQHATKKYIFYNGFHELAYLHPKVFKPEKGILSEFRISSEQKLFIVRFAAFNAHHDIGEKGLNNKQKLQLINHLKKYGRVIVSDENNLDYRSINKDKKLLPSKIHDLISFSTLYVGESQTMTAEAAILGIPAIRINSFKGRLSTLNELEEKYGLLFSYLPDEFYSLLEKIDELMKLDTKKLWPIKRDQMLEDKINVTDFILRVILHK